MRSEEAGAREESEEGGVDISSDYGDDDEIGVDDASLAYARELQREMNALPVWDVYENRGGRRPSADAPGTRRSKRIRSNNS